MACRPFSYKSRNSLRLKSWLTVMQVYSICIEARDCIVDRQKSLAKHRVGTPSTLPNFLKDTGGASHVLHIRLDITPIGIYTINPMKIYAPIFIYIHICIYNIRDKVYLMFIWLSIWKVQLVLCLFYVCTKVPVILS